MRTIITIELSLIIIMEFVKNVRKKLIRRSHSKRLTLKSGQLQRAIFIYKAVSTP